MCERCVTAAREKYALLRLIPQRDPCAPNPRTARRARQRERAQALAHEIGASNPATLGRGVSPLRTSNAT